VTSAQASLIDIPPDPSNGEDDSNEAIKNLRIFATDLSVIDHLELKRDTHSVLDSELH